MCQDKRMNLGGMDMAGKLNLGGMDMAVAVSNGGCHCHAPSERWNWKFPHAFRLKPSLQISTVGSSTLSNAQFYGNCQRGPRLVCRSNASSVSSLKSINPDVALQEAPDKQPPEVWRDFARRVSGEWEGYRADFSSEGKAIELPESVVPEAFREWDVQVYDWQTQCPTLAEEKTIALAYKLIRLLPTVGCEVDAATQHSIDARQIGGVDNEVSSFAFHQSGCYVAVWTGREIKKERNLPAENNSGKQKEKCNVLEIEHCLVEGQNSESRVRIIQQIDLGQINEEWKIGPTLQIIAVNFEQWYGPFKNGEQPGGCAISGSGFASTSPLHAAQVSGIWRAQNLVAELEVESEPFKELVADGYEDITRDSKELVLLPKNLWCILRVVGNDQFISEAGWLLDANSMVTSSCKFSIDGKLKKAIVRFEEQYSRRSEG